MVQFLNLRLSATDFATGPLAALVLVVHFAPSLRNPIAISFLSVTSVRPIRRWLIPDAKPTSVPSTKFSRPFFE